MTVKRTENPGAKTKLFHEETKLCFWVGYTETLIGFDIWGSGSGYTRTTKEDYEALIELAQAAIKELDDVKAQEIEKLERDLKKLKGK